MRRGLIGWSKEEVPDAAMALRVTRTQDVMRKEKLDAVIAYTSFARPNAVSWYTHFVPYWNDGLVVVFPSGLPMMLAAFSKRVEPWIREVARVGDVIMTPNLGKGVIEMLKERIPGLSSGKARIGMIERDELPWPIAEAFDEAGFGPALVDFSAQFATLRQPPDESEMGLARKALAIADKAYAAMPAGARQASQLLSAIDSVARLDGAEEVHLKVAPDLESSGVLQRLEGDARLGARHCISVSLGYKSVWVRTVRMLSAKPPASWAAAQKWLDAAAIALDAGKLASGPSPTGLPGKLAAWTLEACVGGAPLSPIAYGAAGTNHSNRPLPPGSFAILTVQLDLPDGPWHGAANLLLGKDGSPTRLLP
ncbi:MAG: aminopeptidase P family N-terminal domain-containing protein [Burkholderiales bacterium]